MAWVAIPNNPRYEYNNAPTDPGAGSPLRPLWLKQTNGVRTTLGFENYTNVRRVGTTDDIGEMSKNYWDAQT